MGNQQAKEGRYHGRRIDWEHAERPSPPGKPVLVGDSGDQQTDVITIRWAPPSSDGGAPIVGYLVEHRRTGSPHWLRATPHLAPGTELTLTGLEPGWRYQFRVAAENDVGRSEPGELSEPLTVTLQRSAASAPHFNRELHDTVALENEKVEFVVNVIATPPPKISWYKDGFEIFSSRRTKILTDSEQSTLVIHQAALEDEGEIKVTATNRAGHVVSKANLKLEAPPRIRLPRQYEDGLLFEKGEIVRLKVSTAGRPLPRVLWYHNGDLLEAGGRYEITESDRSSTVRISEATRADRGEYLIRGMNKIGEDVATFLVTVTDRPLPPGKAHIAMTLGRSVTLTWTCPDDDGGCKIGNYIVEYFRVGWNMWLKATTCRQLTAILSELIEGSEYKFRVKAENPYGVSEPSEESEVIFIPDAKRGILTPPPREEVPADSWLEEPKKRPSTPEEKTSAQEAKRRRMEEAARKLLDTPLPVLLSQENTTLKIIEKPLRRSKAKSPSASPNFDDREDVDGENVPPPVPKRRNKGDRSPLSEAMMVDESYEEKQLEEVRVGVPRRSSFPPSERAAEDGIGHAQLLSVPGPRENDDSVLHGSSELMLVLYPDERAKSVELSAKQRSEIEMSLIEGGIAPPMSLSAPELGGGEPLEMPLMRDAVSSTELLHERAMARFYQAAADEESQAALRRRFSGDRKSLERRHSMKEAALERRHSMKEEPIKEPSPEALKPSRIPRSIKPAPQEEEKPKPLISRREERLSSIEKEQLEFALVRDRIRQKNEQNLQKNVLPPRPPNLQGGMSSQLSSFEDEEGRLRDDDEDLEEEEEEVEEEEEEDDYYLDEDEVEEEESVMDEPETLNDSKYRPKSLVQPPPPVPKHGVPPPSPKPQVPPAPKPKGTAPRAQEEDTYHPRSMIPTRSVLPKFEAALPVTLEEEQKPLEVAPKPMPREVSPKPTAVEAAPKPMPRDVSPKPTAMEVAAKPRPLKTLELAPPRQTVAIEVHAPPEEVPVSQPDPSKKPEPEETHEDSKIPVPVKEKKKKTPIFKKLGKLTLKKTDKKGHTMTKMVLDTTVPMATISLPKPILKKKGAKKSETDVAVEEPAGPSKDVEDEEDSSRRKKQVRIAEPGLKPPTSTDPKLSPNSARNQRLKRRQESLEEDEQGNQVLIFHYSDIVREFGGAKKPAPKMYLNYEDLEAHVTPEEDKPDPFESLPPAEDVEETATVRSDTEERGSVPDVADVEEVPEEPQPEPEAPEEAREEAPSARSSSERTHSPSPVLQRALSPEERVRGSMDYITDLAMFIVACWLYLFKNELYAIPVLCLMVYRQVSDSVQEKYAAIKESISNKIPERFRKKSSAGEEDATEDNEEEN